MTGAHLARIMLQIRGDIPIVLCTGFSEILDEKQARAMGIRQYVMKPVVANELAKAIRKVLDPDEPEGRG